jgi:site-specific DNA recombinase
MQRSRRIAGLERKLRAKEKPASSTAKVRAVGYVRVSTDRQVDAYGPKVQGDSIRSFAQSQGYELVSVVADEGVSGAVAPLDRPGFQQVARLAAAGEFSVLLLYKFDRLARQILHAVNIVHLLRDRYEIAIRSVTEPIDTATPMGRTIFTVLAGMAEQERETITERTWGGRRQKAKEGGYSCGGVPFGYDADADKKLVVNEVEAAVVRRMFDMRNAGATYQKIADALNADGLKTKRGNKWRPGGVAHILDNPIYRGDVEYFFRRFGSGELVRGPGAHEAIIAS